jgi:ribonuclease HI
LGIEDSNLSAGTSWDQFSRALPSPELTTVYTDDELDSAGVAWLRLNCDGASRGNPGPAAVGAVLYDQDGLEVEALNKFIGRATNNVAEYEALLLGIESALRRKPQRLSVRADSELLVRQIKGEYKVRDSRLQTLHRRAMAMLEQFESWEIEHVPREMNTRADMLANQALDSVLKR